MNGLTPRELDDLEQQMLRNTATFNLLTFQRIMHTFEMSINSSTTEFSHMAKEKILNARQQKSIELERRKKRSFQQPRLGGNKIQKIQKGGLFSSSSSRSSSSSSSTTTSSTSSTSTFSISTCTTDTSMLPTVPVSALIDWSLIEDETATEARKEILVDVEETRPLVKENAERASAMLIEAVHSYQRIISSKMNPVYHAQSLSNTDLSNMATNPSDSMIGHLLASPSPPRWC